MAYAEELYMNHEMEKPAMPWLHGPIDRTVVDSMMRDNGFVDGLFLIREKAGAPGDYVLSCVTKDKLQHYVVSSKTGRLKIDDGPQFSTLVELVEYYSNNDDRLPTRLKRYCPSLPSAPRAAPQESYEMVWEAKSTAQAQIGTSGNLTLTKGSGPMLSMGSQQMLGSDPTALINAQLKSVTLPRSNRPAISTPHSGPQAPFSSYEEEQEHEDVGSVRVIVEEGGSPYATSNAPPPRAQQQAFAQQQAQQQAPDQRKNFTEIPRVKQWIEKGAEVQQVSIVVNDDTKKRTVPLEGMSVDSAADRANKHLETFSQAALAEEKMYLIWFNSHLKKLGRDQVADIGPSLKTGVDVLEVLKVLAKQPAPMYAKRPMVVQQEVDNWHVVIKFMRKLGIVVDNEPGMNKEDGVGIDPILLHGSDRREFLKFFSKLLLYEAQHR